MLQPPSVPAPVAVRIHRYATFRAAKCGVYANVIRILASLIASPELVDQSLTLGGQALTDLHRRTGLD